WRNQMIERCSEPGRGPISVYHEYADLRRAAAILARNIIRSALRCRIGITDQTRRQFCTDVLGVRVCLFSAITKVQFTKLASGCVEREIGDQLIGVTTSLRVRLNAPIENTERERFDTERHERLISAHRRP